MKKRITSGILALCMLISLFPVTALATYSDIDGHWGEEAIERWSEYGIVEGDGENFNPDGLMTRGAAAAVFARLLGLSDKADISSDLPEPDSPVMTLKLGENSTSASAIRAKSVTFK